MTSSHDSTKSCSPPRRSFCKGVLAVGLTATAAAVPIVPGIQVVLDSVEQKGLSGKSYALTTLDGLDGTPRKFVIVDDVKDAWTTQPNKKIGAVFLYKTDNEQVKAFHSVCPHAGCVVEAGVRKNPQTNQDEPLFYCPCHAAHFALDGKRLDAVSPRDLDSLEVEVKDGKVWVRFEQFITGTADKKASA